MKILKKKERNNIELNKLRELCESLKDKLQKEETDFNEKECKIKDLNAELDNKFI